MDTFGVAGTAIATIVFAEAVKEIGKNIGQAICDFVVSTVNFISDTVKKGFQAIFCWG
ncbi:hypothetical protein VB620_07560 [Nodularia harveyana UHCC-0300]|uniref:Uncharacterized protein n=1 Tax=Nodularia harveyana UHCC-0300 TaxID=2974287 RepID=A0ABU5UCD5_9CYAN|nr:hypothetical protein [Nodularia harveyana]MEA5581194.1 hypothetical protein [Nodularia harveyana UHCC-0300]